VAEAADRPRPGRCGTQELEAAPSTRVEGRTREFVATQVLDSSLTLAELKNILESETAVPPERQKLLGLKAAKGKVTDETQLGALVLKLPAHRFMLMGTPEDQLLQDPPPNMPKVLDDWSLSGDHATKYTAWEWCMASKGELDGFNEGTSRPWRCVFVDTFSKDELDPALWSHQTDCNRWVHNDQHRERQLAAWSCLDARRGRVETPRRASRK
jgi:hypothetical protein